MQFATHSMTSTAPSGMTPRRAMIIGGVGLLHVAVIYALINGMATTAIQQIETAIQLQPRLEHPTTTARIPPVAPIPRFKIADDTPPVIDYVPPPGNPPPVQADTAATGVGGTHTVPPYPALASNLAHQGTVVLQLTVSASGDVTSATVVQSSGFAELDAAGIAWVTANWKYKPATQGGISVASQTKAAVKFDLKQALR